MASIEQIIKNKYTPHKDKEELVDVRVIKIEVDPVDSMEQNSWFWFFIFLLFFLLIISILAW